MKLIKTYLQNYSRYQILANNQLHKNFTIQYCRFHREEPVRRQLIQL